MRRRYRRVSNFARSSSALRSLLAWASSRARRTRSPSAWRSRLTGCRPASYAGAVESAGGMVTAFDVTAARGDRLQVDLTCRRARRRPRRADRRRRSAAVEGVTVGKVSDRTFLLHLGGKIEVQSKVPLRTRDDLSMAYTPGVARVCRAIAERPEDVRRLTIKRNTVAVVTDGSAVLGPRQHRSRGRAAGDGGQGGAVQAVRRHRRLADLPATPRTPTRSSAPSRSSPRCSAASTSRTSPRHAASRSSAGCASCSTSPSSTTTSTARRSSCSPR